MCNKCNRIVKETIHTAETWKVDYYQSSKDGENVITECTDCKDNTEIIEVDYEC